jgi:hypothetical protein
MHSGVDERADTRPALFVGAPCQEKIAKRFSGCDPLVRPLRMSTLINGIQDYSKAGDKSSPTIGRPRGAAATIATYGKSLTFTG